MSLALSAPSTSSANPGFIRSAAVAGAVLVSLVAVRGGLSGSGVEPAAVVGEQVTASLPPRSVSGPAPVAASAAASAETLVGLHERTGLTWDELARLLGVSRRTVHYWKNGAAPSAARERRLNQISEVIGVFSVEPERMRAALRSSVGGRTIIDVIAMGASASLVRAHLSSLVGPATTATSAPHPGSLLLPPRPRDPRQVDVRLRLARGASPGADEQG